MAQRQNTKFYGLRKIWQVGKGFGSIVCISENLVKNQTINKISEPSIYSYSIYLFSCSYKYLSTNFEYG